MKKTMELAGITASVVIGAGFATGREIISYFTKYGDLSYFIIAGVAVLLYAGMLLLLRRSSRWGSGKIIAVPYVFFGYILMLAALGQLIQDYTGLPAAVGIMAGAILSVLGLLAGFGRFTVFSGWVTPIAAAVLVAIAALSGDWLGTGVRPPAQNFIYTGDVPVVFSSLQFVGYNFLSALIVLPEISREYGRKQKLLGVGMGVLILTFCMIAINGIFLCNYCLIRDSELPLIHAICLYKNRFTAMLAVSLLCLIFVLSLCGSAVGMARMIGKGRAEFKIGLCFVLVAIPLSMFGFGSLMDNIYPLFGLLGVAAFLYAIKCSKTRHGV